MQNCFVSREVSVGKRASYLELFFDLVFVFAVTQLAGMLHDDHTFGGWARAGLMAWLLWWAWSQYTWAGNAIDLGRRPVRIALLTVTGLVLLTAQAIPHAFDDKGLWFALPYALVRLTGLALYWFGLRDEPEHRAALRTYLPLAAIPPLIVLAGGVASPGARPWIWVVALAVDLVSVAAAGRGEFRVAPDHFAERHALIVIIALGESIVAVGATATELEPTALLAMASAAAFAIVALLWWTYFDRVQAAAEHRLSSEPDHRRRGHLARDLFTLLHLPIVTGIVVFAVGVEEALLHPDEPLATFGLVAVAAGLSLFALGFVAGTWRATHRLFAERLVAAVAVVAATALLGPHLSALTLLVLLAGILTVTAAVEWVRQPVATPVG
jgi:low temperature requirement protein LtrA